MAVYEAGSVNAKIILDTKEFNEAIGKLKSEVKDLKTSFNSIKGNGLTEEIEKLKKEMDSLKTTNENYRKTIDNLRKSLKNKSSDLNTLTKDENKYNEAVVKVDRSVQNLKKSTDELGNSQKKLGDKGIFGRNKSDTGIVRTEAEEIKRLADVANKASVQLEKLAKAKKEANSGLVNDKRGQAYSGYAQWSGLIQGEVSKIEDAFIGLDKKLIDSYYSFNNFMRLVPSDLAKAREAAEKYRQRVGLIADELKAKWHSMTAELAKANAAQYKYWQQSRGSVSGFAEPLPIKGYNDYLKVVKEATEATKQFEATNRKQSINLNTYKANLTGVTKEMDKMAQSAQRVKNAQLQLQYFQRTDYLNQYKANMTEINQKLAEQEGNARKAGRGLTSFNNGVVQTAHSGRILSNTLYQIRGALLSLKMIFTAMGGMMLWGFAMDIAESVKETVTAKNEMEAQLKQNTNVDTAGIRYFRKELDKLPKTFQKVNKYAVGETVSSIGLEFNLSAKQMKKALPIVTMIQSEYVRAGRKTSEAALAVKDILQGEFQRLSRETGVGEEELTAYGWDGDKTNIDGLLKALKKAALDRHWDVFAKKATSLNDVIEITKSRFSEFGADLLDSITPLIVGGFNTIIDTIEGLQKAFNKLGSFGQNFLLIGGGTALFGGILTALPMVTKGMGLAEIATLGWKKSIATAVLNLNKAEVGAYGFRKALAATISGTNAASLANTRWTKSIMGRILGLNQSTLAEHGYLTSLVKSRMELTKGITIIDDSGIAAMNLRQKIIYLAKGELVADKASAGWGKTIKSLITSTKLWRVALLGITGIGLVTWLASTAAWADAVKKRFDKYNAVLSEGKDKIKSYENDVETYTNNLAKQNDELAGLTKGTDKYNKKLQEIQLTTKNLETSKHNVEDMTQAYKLAKEIKKTSEETAKNNDLMIGRGLEDIYSDNGVKNVEKYGKAYQQLKYLKYDAQKAEEERYKFEYASLQHINEHVEGMKKAGIAEKDRVKYITEYNMKAEEAAQHLKEFNQGDMTAGAYYLLDRLTLAWIDMWNDKDFINFWNAVKKTFEDLKPHLIAAKDAIVELGRNLIKFFSTDSGRWVGTIALAASAFGILAWKLKGVFGKAKDAVSGLKGVWKWLKKTRGVSDERKDTPDADTSTTPTTTGGTVGGVEKGKFWETVGQDARNTGRTMFKYAGYIAAAMFLVTEAIVLLNAPMLALTGTGALFERVEPQVKKGIEGLKLIAPTVIAIMVPMVALMYVFDKYKVDSSRMIEAFKTTAIGVALAITLVTEAIVLLNAPLLGLAVLGSVYGGVRDSAQQGIEAIQVSTDALKALVPWIPVFIAGIALAAIATTGAGSIVYPVAIAGIASGVLLVAGAVVAMYAPLKAIEALGSQFTDLDGVRQGAEALKVAAEALGYVEEATRELTLVHWELLADYVAQLIGVNIGINLTELTVKGGFLDQLKTFVDDFSQYELEIPEGFEDKVTALKTAGESVGAIGDAMLLAKQAMDNLPDEFKNGGASITYDMETDTTSVKKDNTVESYFDTFKEPIKQLKQFVDDFNNSDEFAIEPVDTGRVENINSAATMITQINTAVEQVKTAMQNVGSAGHETAFATGGAFMALGYDLFHMTGLEAINNGTSSGGYKSSLGSSLQAMEDVISDMFTFQSRISQYGGEGGGENPDVGGVASIVTRVQEAISSLSQSLSDAVPTMEGHGKSIGSAIVNGVKSGLEGMGSDISSKVATAIDAAKPTAETYGKGLGWKVQNGFETELKISETLTTEVNTALTAIGDGKAQEFYDKGKALGDAFARGFKDGSGIHSPGYAAQAMQSEIGYIGQYLNDGIMNLPSLASQLGNALSSNFNLDFNLSNFQLPDMSQWTSQLSTVIPTVDGIKTQVSTNFDTMKTNVQNSFSGIVSKTQTSMSSMKVATIGHIGSIKSSWRGMQDALIASAENIKSQTGQKINNLKTNMADFWRKIQNPSALIGGAAAGPTGTRPRRYGSQSRLKGLYAGNTPTSIKAPDIGKDLKEYLRCMMETGGNCFAGGWSFDWNKPIQDKFNNWNTHFGKYKIDDHVKVGKFYNNSFPVKGIAEIAKAYIYDTIAATNYSKYFNSKFSEDPVAALKAGAFNCWDGTNIVLAIARAFGFDGSRGFGTWSGIGHVWANIPGLGIIDPTAIQGGYGFTSPKVKGYHAGGTISRSASAGDAPVGNTTNHNEEIHIHIHGDIYGVEDLDARIDEGANRVARRLFRNSYSGV